MAKKSRHTSHLIIVVLVAIALVGTVIWLCTRMDLSLTAAAGIVTVGLVIFALLYLWAERMGDDNAVNNERTLLVQPILENYREDHNKKRLLREYAKWAEGMHDPEVQYEFLRDVIQALVDDRHNAEGGMRLDELKELAVTDELRANYEEFTSKIEAQIRQNQAERDTKDAEA